MSVRFAAPNSSLHCVAAEALVNAMQVYTDFVAAFQDVCKRNKLWGEQHPHHLHLDSLWPSAHMPESVCISIMRSVWRRGVRFILTGSQQLHVEA